MTRPNARRGVAATVTVQLQDHGQDFTEFDIDLESMRITETRPYQGWLWTGSEIRNAVLRRGDRLHLRTENSPDGMVLRYPIDQVGPAVPKRGALL